MHHIQQKYQTLESQYWLKQTKTVHDEIISVTSVVRHNMANDAFDQKFRNHNKNQFENATIENFCLALYRLVKAACAQSGRLLPWHMHEGECATAQLQCSIDNALVQFFARCFDALAQLINRFNSALIYLNTALQETLAENALLHNVWFILEILSQVYLPS